MFPFGVFSDNISYCLATILFLKVNWNEDSNLSKTCKGATKMYQMEKGRLQSKSNTKLLTKVKIKC